MFNRLKVLGQQFQAFDKEFVKDYVAFSLQESQGHLKVNLENHLELGRRLIGHTVQYLKEETSRVELITGFEKIKGKETSLQKILERKTNFHIKILHHSIPDNIIKELNSKESGWINEKSLPSHFKAKLSVEKSGGVVTEISGKTEIEGNPKKLKMLFPEHKDFVLIGDPGSGKSWQLAKYCHSLYEDLKASRSAFVPVFLSAGEFMNNLKQEKTEGKNEFVLFLRGTMLQQTHLNQILNDERLILWMAQTGSFIFIFDGINEIGDREAFAQMLKKFNNKYPLNRYVISSRKRLWAQTKNMFQFIKPVIDMVGLAPSEIEDFLRRIFFDNEDSYKELISKLGIDEYARALSQTRQKTIFLKELIPNPFFLDKIARLFISRKELPKNRGSLFKDYMHEYAKHKEWYSLQEATLSFVGMYITHQEFTGGGVPVELARKLLFIGFCSAPKQCFEYDGKKLLTHKELGNCQLCEEGRNVDKLEDLMKDIKSQKISSLQSSKTSNKPLVEHQGCMAEPGLDYPL